MQQINIQSDGDGGANTTDEAGKPIDWINRVMIELDPVSKAQTLFFGTTKFKVSIQAGDVVAPVPAPTPTPAS